MATLIDVDLTDIRSKGVSVWLDDWRDDGEGRIGIQSGDVTLYLFGTREHFDNMLRDLSESLDSIDEGK